MPVITPKGGVTPLGADTTAGHRGIPARRDQEGGAAQLPSDGSPRRDNGEDMQSTNTRGGPTSGKMYERPLSRLPRESGDGSGQ
jgi:hypothetical protein